MKRSHQFLRYRFPEIYSTINRELNPNINIHNLMSTSKETVTWSCNKTNCDHHIWTSTVLTRIKNKHPCPFCLGKYTCKCNSLYIMEPEIMKDWDYEENDKIELDPKKLAPHANKYAYWSCSKSTCDHHKWKV
jgi:hypothetical protein